MFDYQTLASIGNPFSRETFRGKVVIYGAGNIGRCVWRALKRDGVCPACFLDAYSSLKEINGIPVLRPDNACIDKASTVIIAVFNRERSAQLANIRALLTREGFLSVYSFEQFYLCSTELFDETYFWLGPADILKKNIVDLEKVEKMLADEVSRQLFRKLIKYRLTGDPSELPMADCEYQYMPRDVPLLPPPYRFADIGAYDGDTLISFKKKNIEIDTLFAFEPDINNFNKLVSRLKVDGPFSTGLSCLYPCVVSRHCAMVNFEQASSESSKVICEAASNSLLPKVSVPAISIDDVLYNAHLNYIKLDVEGYEEEVLLGLKATIEKDQPMLAISVYHKPEDLFVLPLLIAQWNYSASYYLRLHGEHGFDTVLYAVPKKLA